MKQYKTIQVQKQVPNRMICNCCGQEIQITKQHPYPEYVSIRKEWGYPYHYYHYCILLRPMNALKIM